MWTIWGDPHAKPDNLEKLAQLFDWAEQLGNPVLILGDLLDTKEVVRGSCLNFCLERMARSRLKFRILVGNHDWFNLECQDHSLRALALLPNVEVVAEPQVLDFGSGVSGLCVPYIHHADAFLQVIQGCPPGVPLLVMHQGVTGFDYGNGRIAETEGGIVPEAALVRFRKVYSGHFHAYQKRGNLVFIGTPFSHSHGESDQRKYIGLFDPKRMHEELLESPFPRHVTLHVDCDVEEKDQTLAGLRAAVERKDHVRVVLSGTQDHINRFDTSLWPEVKFIEKPITVENEAVVVSEVDSNEVKFQKWAEEIKGLDSETVKLGLEILRSVQK